MSKIAQGPMALGPSLGYVSTVLLAAVIVVIVAGCTPASTPVQPTATAALIAGDEPALLHVLVRPADATVLVDGEPRGLTPLTLSLAPGQHLVRVEKNGYQALEKKVVLVSL